MRHLELLAPARNADIGIAAIDCGADAVYMAGPSFGARQAAGNSMEDVRRVCDHAHRFGARVFLALNTIIYDSELSEARRILHEAEEAGVDAVIAQDIAVFGMTSLPVHASTQCAIRTPEKAAFLRNAGASRLILERQLSLRQIKEIRNAVDCELEFFVHGALCVCYSGQCYMSEQICGRSANRGACVQACRSLYDLTDDSGRVLVRNKALLSLKDFSLIDRLEDLAEAGVTSLKIEGRLKNISYVRNVVRAYSIALDKIVAASGGKYARASFGRVSGGFSPDLKKTFNRGYTELYLDGKRGQWSSMNAPKSIGEEIGKALKVISRQGEMTLTMKLRQGIALKNGDGFSFLRGSEIVGFRGDVCSGNVIRCRAVEGIAAGTAVYRNLSAEFEKSLENGLPARRIAVSVQITASAHELLATATTEDGRTATCRLTDSSLSSQQPHEAETNAQLQQTTASANYLQPATANDMNQGQTKVSQKVDGCTLAADNQRIIKTASFVAAENQERMREMFRSQVSKTVGIYAFSLDRLEANGSLPFMSAASLNEIRRNLAAQLDEQACIARPLFNVAAFRPSKDSEADTAQSFSETRTQPSHEGERNAGLSGGEESAEFLPDGEEDSETQQSSERKYKPLPERADYKANIANEAAKEFYAANGAESIEDAFELRHQKEAELMRSKYCIRFELGLCPKHQKASPTGNLFLVNNGKRYPLVFDCARCEMVVKAISNP